jgi:hypothetical protein
MISIRMDFTEEQDWCWVYDDETGKLLFSSHRWEGETFSNLMERAIKNAIETRDAEAENG